MSEAEPIRLTRAQAREVDRLASERYHVPSIVLMENAARAVVDVALQRLGGTRAAKVLVMCGGGNNGGDGLAIARHLHNRQIDVRIGFHTDPAKYKGDALINWQIVQSMNLPFSPLMPSQLVDGGYALLIDAIFGTGLTEPPRDPFDDIVSGVFYSAAEVVAVDVPSGLDCDTGKPFGPCISATHTVTFVAEKIGFSNPVAKDYLGEITVGDIGCPRELIEDVARDIR